MPILADTIDGVIGVDTHPGHPRRRRAHPGRWDPRPDHHAHHHCRLAAAPRCRPRARARAALLGGGGRRQLWRRADRVRPRPRRASRGGCPTQAAPPAAPAPRPTRSMRSVLGVTSWLRSTWRYHAAVATVRRCGCCWHQTPRHRQPCRRGQPAQGTRRRRPRGTTRRAARHDHFRPDHSLRGLAGPASQAVGAPHDGPGAAHHRPANPVPPSRDRRARRRTRHAGGRGRAMAGRSPRCWADHRRAGPGELVVCRPVALAKQRLRPWPGPARSRLHRGRSPAIG